MMTKDFKKYFPLPWHILFYGDGVHFIDSEKDSGFWIMEDREGNAAKKQDSAEGRAAMQYMIKCGNLMPEAVELLDDAQNIMKWTCELCDGEACGRCGGCDVKGIGSRIAALLAKLEGGAEE